MSQSSFLQESKKLSKLSFPIIVGQLGQNIIALADTVMIGALGSIALGASAFAGSLFIIFLIFGIGVLAPITAKFAHMQGKKDYENGGILLYHSLLVAIALGIIITSILFLLWPQLHLFGQTKEVSAAAKPFYILIALSVLPGLIYQAYKQFTDGIGDTKVAMYIMLFGVVLNVFGNYVLINGYWGFPKLGLAGAALATLIARIVMAILLVSYVHIRKKYKKYLTLSWKSKPDKILSKEIFRLGLPNGFTFVFEVGAFASAAVMMGWFGASPLAAHQITISLASTTFLVAMGIGIAASIRVGNELGEDNPRGARHSGLTAIAVGAIYMSICSVVIYLLRHILPTFYVSDIDVINLAASFFFVVALFQVFDGVQAVAIGALRGMSDTKWPSFIAFFAYWIMGLPGGYLLAFHLGLGPVGVWIGLLVGLIIASIMLTLRFYYLSNKNIQK